MKHPGPLPQPRIFDQRWAANLVVVLERYFKTLSGPWESQARLTTRKGRRVNVTTNTASAYTILETDDLIDVARAGAVTLTLPASPDRGQRHQIQDSSGAAGTNTITILPAAGNINGGTSAVLNANYGRRVCYYNGTQWISA